LSVSTQELIGTEELSSILIELIKSLGSLNQKLAKVPTQFGGFYVFFVARPQVPGSHPEKFQAP